MLQRKEINWNVLAFISNIEDSIYNYFIFYPLFQGIACLMVFYQFLCETLGTFARLVVIIINKFVYDAYIYISQLLFD